MRSAWARKGLGFALLPLIGLATPLLVLPALTAAYGLEGWVAVAIGQSVGGALATIVELGWGLSGPQRVARMSRSGAFRALVLSLQSRVYVSIAVAPVAFAVAASLSPHHKAESALTAVATLFTAFSLNWFFLGRAQPGVALMTDGVTRLTFAVLAALLLPVLGLWVFPVFALIIPSIVAIALGGYVAWRGTDVTPTPFGLRRLNNVLRVQAAATSTRAVSSVYIALPVTLMSIVSPSSVAVFAAGERLFRMALAATAAVPNAMQGWVGSSPNQRTRNARVDRAILLSIGLGVGFSLAFGLLAPWLSSCLFSDVATISTPLAWTFAAVMFVVTVSRATGGIGLVAFSAVPALMRSTVVGAVIGIPVFLIAGSAFGAIGGALGELVAEVCVLSVQVGSLIAIRKGRRRRELG